MKRFIFFLLVPALIFAQTGNESIIEIDANSEVYILANIIFFDISLESEHSNAREAFNLNKVLEQRLLRLLTNFEIPDSAINYSLLNIRKQRTRENKILFKTKQNVTFKTENIKQYSDIQIALLDSGFYQFKSRFSSSKLNEAKEKGYYKSLLNAKNDAGLVAKGLGKKLGKVLKIKMKSYDSPYVSSTTALTVISPKKALTEIEQSIRVNTRLNITFEVK